MSRFNVLISAYACEPGKGSEPEVGWQWALQMARFHDVTVLTRANNRASIEEALADYRGTDPLPRFLYHDEPAAVLSLKRLLRAPRLYYRFWQRSARRIIADQLQKERFDLLHHITFASFRYPIAITGHGVPSIWGPIGGIESIPAPLLPWRYPGQFAMELGRNVTNAVQANCWTAARRSALKCNLTLASTREMEQALNDWKVPTQLMPTIGLDTSAFPIPRFATHSGQLRLLYVGNFLPLKGFDLALEALKMSQTNALFTLIGDGPFLEETKRLAHRLGVDGQTQFRGRIPRSQVLGLYDQFDVLLFPSLHDSGGYAVIEAMCSGLPVICVNVGGPGISVREECGVRVPSGSRASVVGSLAAAIRMYDQNRSLVIEHGRNARESVIKNYDWSTKAAEMGALYRSVAATGP